MAIIIPKRNIQALDLYLLKKGKPYKVVKHSKYLNLVSADYIHSAGKMTIPLGFFHLSSSDIIVFSGQINAKGF